MKAWFLGATILAPAALCAQGARPLTSLRVVDAQGGEGVVSNATIDYGGMISTDVQRDGIRLQQGDGAVLVKWSAVDTIRVTTVTDSTRPPTLRLEVVLRNGTRRPATLFEKGHMLIVGQTDLGNYALDLHKVRSIVPVR
jgi:hypothetical protein